MAVENAWNPLIVAAVSTIATVFQAMAGSGCSFVKVEAEPNEVLAIIETSLQQASYETTMGLVCDGDFYDLDGDRMRKLSRSFYFLAASMGAVTLLIAWGVSTCCTPTTWAWRSIAVFASLSALTSLPTFLVLETYPCEDFDEQSCSLSRDSYLLIGAVALYISVTALTQFLDPPNWVSQLHHWRLTKTKTMDTTNQWSLDDDDNGSDEPMLQEEAPEGSFFSRQKRSRSGKSKETSRSNISYVLPITDVERGDSLVEEEVVSTHESDQPDDKSVEKSGGWTAFEPSTNTFKEKDPIALTEGLGEPKEDDEPADVFPKSSSRQKPSVSTASWPPVYLIPAEEPETDILDETSYMDTPSTPSASRRVQPAPVSPLTHHTDPADGEDYVNMAQVSTPAKKLDFSLEESILDGANGNDSLLDDSFERANPDAPFIPSAEEAKQMASRGYAVYADLLKEQEIASQLTDPDPPEYNIDDLINGDVKRDDDQDVIDEPMEDPILEEEDVREIATQGTPIYASLLLEQEERIASTPTLSKEEGEAKLARAKNSPWTLGTPLKRPNSGYNKLENASSSDEDAEEFPMTEVSFDPNGMNEVTLDKDDVHNVQNKDNKVLLDDWNEMFDANGLLPVNTQKEFPKEHEADDEEDDDEDDEAELLRLITSEDFSGEDASGDGDKNESHAPCSSPDKPPRSGGKTILRPKRRARRIKKRTGGSVGSAPSLLDVTIEEETPSDLEDFNKEAEKTVQNPLTGYSADSGNKNHNVVTSLHMTGMHSYHTVEHHRTEELQQITSGVQEALKRGRTEKADQVSGYKGSRSLSPSAARVSMWRSERENRGGIHDDAVVSSSDDDEPGTLVNDLRHARIQRLQQGGNQSSAIARARKRRDRFFGDMQPSFGPSSTSTAYKKLALVTPPPAKATVERPLTASRKMATDDDSHTTTPDDVGEIGSFLMGGLDLELNDLDASLAQLQREDGTEYGPDEHSI